jgi:KaiC/GvpD/RAD55 family RecA-like ATPase
MLTERGQRRRVAAVRDRWLVEEEWWREPIERAYWAVELADGGVRTFYTDTISGAWYAQAY